MTDAEITLDLKSTDSNVMLTFAATDFVIVPLQLAVINYQTT